jgi:hypothetical protein
MAESRVASWARPAPRRRRQRLRLVAQRLRHRGRCRTYRFEVSRGRGQAGLGIHVQAIPLEMTQCSRRERLIGEQFHVIMLTASERNKQILLSKRSAAEVNRRQPPQRSRCARLIIVSRPRAVSE